MKQVIFGVLLGILGAQSVPVMAADVELGRFFYTAEERAALDKLRYAKQKKVKKKTVTKVSILDEPEEQIKLKAFQFNGIVMRKNGPNTAFVDGKKILQKGRNEQGVLISPEDSRDGALAVQLPGARSSFSLQPGESFNPDRKQTDGLLQRTGQLP